MYNIPEQLKTIYKNDFLPAVPQNYFKYLLLYFPELNLTIDTRDSGRIDIDSFNLDESLCSASDLTLGSCEASIFKIKINGIVQDLTGKKFIATQYVIDGDTTYEMPLGTFWVNNAGKQSDFGFKEITAFDSMKNMDVDVSAWYNGLTWPQNLKSMRESLLSYLALPYEDQSLTNDTISLTKTVNPSSLMGREVLRRLTEINAGFGHFTRNGKFKVVQLSGLGLYPSEKLYPAEDLFPSESGEYITAGYEFADYEEYIVESISSVTIREDDEDTGATAGTPGNNYIISGNFLLYGKSAAELQTIADNIFLQVKNKYYRPHSTTMIGLPYLEVGDSVTIITSDDAIESFIFKRTLSGIHALKDEISAAGNQYRDQKVKPTTEIQQLKGKTLRIQRNVDQLSINMSDMEAGLESQITQTAGQLQTQITDNKNSLQSQIIQTAGSLQTQITDNKNSLQSQITQTASSLQTQITDNKNNSNSQISQLSGSISLKVNKGDVSSQLSVESGQVTIGSNRLIVDSNNFKLDALGNATFSGKVKGATIEGDGLTCTNGINTTTIKDGSITTSYINASIVNSPNILVNGQIPALQNHTHYTTEIYTSVSSGGINFQNGIQAAGYNWVNTNFQRVSSSDIRLKKNYRTLEELPLSLYMELKPYLYEFKLKDYGEGIRMGFMAQQIEQTFVRYGLNPFDFNLVQKKDPREGTDEDQYVFLDGKVHIVNYENMHAWTAHVLQTVVEKMNEQEEKLNRIDDRLKALEEGGKQNG